VAKRHFVIVGGGLGGLATGLRLAHRGHGVTILEKNAEVGGRNSRVQVNGCDFDGGASLMMMLDPFRQLYRDVDERIEDHLDLKLCDPSYRVFFGDGTTIYGTPNVARMVDQIERMSGRQESERYGKLLGDLAELYRLSIPNFVRRNYNSPLDLVSVKSLGIVTKHKMLTNLAKRMETYVEDPRLRMLFTFQTMYLGLSPFDAPWVYAVLTYMEYGEGIWYPMGGLSTINESIASLAQRRGAEIITNANVTSIEGNTAVLSTGERISGDAVICNMDLPLAEKTIAKQPAPKKERRYSCSAYTLYIDYEGDLPELLHHNIFFGNDFKANLDGLFHAPMGVHDDPAFYCCVSSKSDPARATPGHSNVFVLVPCPNDDYTLTEADETKMREHVYRRLAEATGFDPSRVRGIVTRNPQTWKQEFNLDKGATFGLAHDFMQSVCFRPDNRSKTNPSLFYVGASTVPGNGLPMVLISAELAEKRLVEAGLI
jgi:phytoene desaturase